MSSWLPWLPVVPRRSKFTKRPARAAAIFSGHTCSTRARLTRPFPTRLSAQLVEEVAHRVSFHPCHRARRRPALEHSPEPRGNSEPSHPSCFRRCRGRGCGERWRTRGPGRRAHLNEMHQQLAAAGRAPPRPRLGRGTRAPSGTRRCGRPVATGTRGALSGGAAARLWALHSRVPLPCFIPLQRRVSGNTRKRPRESGHSRVY